MTKKNQKMMKNLQKKIILHLLIYPAPKQKKCV